MFFHRPPGFEDISTNTNTNGMIPDDMLPPSDDSDNEDIGDMVVNTNRAQVVYEETDSSSDEEEADDSQHGVTINKDDET